MKLIRTIEIGPHTVPVYEDPEIEDAGLWEPRRNRIRVAPHLGTVDLAVTIAHEAIHAILGCNGIELEESAEERIADAIALGLVQTLGPEIFNG